MSAAALQPQAGEGRLASFDWRQVERDLDAQGSALLSGLLTPEECAAIAGLYPREDGFRSRVVMSRHGFGRGEYRYFAYPLPALVGGLRCPFVGTVSMDLIIVDVTHAPAGAAVRGAPVTLIGGELDLEAVGAGAKTIGYEVLTSLGRRHARRYVGL